MARAANVASKPTALPPVGSELPQMPPASKAVTPETLPISAGWPALMLAVVVSVAAYFSFSHRPVPPFPPTMTHPGDLLVTDIAERGGHYVAVGELGRILVAASAQGPWQEVPVTPQRASSFTRVLFVDDTTALAVGHDSWIVRSTDAGKTWAEVAFDPEAGESLLGIGGPFDGRLFAFGTFGRLLMSQDGGVTWQREQQPEIGDRHLSAITQAADGALILVGETGRMLRSADNGETWTRLPDIYTGSFYGILRLPSDALVVFGMRGNAFVSRDNGATWKASTVPGGLSLYDGFVDHDGSAILVGENSSVFRSTDDGAHFTLIAEGERKRVAAALPMPDGDGWLTVGEAGIGIEKAGIAAGVQE